MNPLSEIKDEFSDYFRNLGYQVSWDFNKRTGEKWYEIMKDGKLVCQVDIGTPLKDFLTDLPLLAEDKDGISPIDYTVNTGPKENLLFKEMAKRC